MDAIRVHSEDSSNQQSNCEACSKKLAELWLKQVDPTPCKEALDEAIKKAYIKVESSKSTQQLIIAVVVLMSLSFSGYYSLTTMPLLSDSLPTNVVMFGREEDMKNLTKLWVDDEVHSLMCMVHLAGENPHW